MKMLYLIIINIFFLFVQTFAFPKQNEGRIVGGVDSDIYEAPYLVSLEFDVHICGASILSNKLLLTAAHCVFNESPKKMWIRAGSTNSNKGGVRVKVHDYLMNPNYNFRNHDSDIALLFLEDDIFEACPACKAVTLGTAEPQAGDNLTIRGWGQLSQDGEYPDALRKVTVQIMEKKLCQKLIFIFQITENMFCGQKDNKGVCHGDSGSPAMNHNEQQVGIVSFGGCANYGYPEVYTVVSQFSDWINYYKQQHF